MTGPWPRALRWLVIAALACVDCSPPRQTGPSAKARLEDGKRLFSEGDLDTALSVLEGALDEQDQAPEALSYIAQIYRHRRQLENGAEAFEAIIREHGQLADAHFHLARFLAELQEVDRASGAYLRALALDPTHAPALRAYITLCEESGRYADGIAAIRGSPRGTDPLFQHLLGMLLQQDGQLEQAVEAFRRVLSQRPAVPATLAALGRALAHLGHEDEAGQRLEAALDHDPENLVALHALANLRYRQGRDREAEPLMSRFRKRQTYVEELLFVQSKLAMTNDEAQVNLQLGQLSERHGHAAQAEVFYRRALAFDPSLAAAREGLARLQGSPAQQ